MGSANVYGTMIIDLESGAILDADQDALAILGVPSGAPPSLRPEVIDQTHSPHVWGSIARALRKRKEFRCVRGVRWHHEHQWIWTSQTYTRISPKTAVLRIEPCPPPPPIADSGLTLVCPTTGSRLPRSMTGKLRQAELDSQCAADIVGEPCYAACPGGVDRRWVHSGRDPSDC